MTRAEIELENAVIAEDEARARLASIKRPEAAWLFASGSDYFHSVQKLTAAYFEAARRVRRAEAAF
jgi:predicted esterase YcpF (UPF0227 family)